MGKKKRKYASGGEINPELQATFDRIEAMDASLRPSSSPPSPPSAPSSPPVAEEKPDYDKMSFGQAFAAARKVKGRPNFTWRGKSYNTSLKGEASKPATKPPAKPSRPKPAALPGPSSEAWAGSRQKAEPAKKPAARRDPVAEARARTAAAFAKAKAARERHLAAAKNPKSLSKMAKGGSVRGDGCAARGRTKGRMY